MLRICAKNLYGWHCDHESVAEAVAIIDAWDEWDAYPASWPQSPRAREPMGVMEINDGIRASARNRLERIKHDLENAGEFYPKDQVRGALAHWKIDL